MTGDVLVAGGAGAAPPDRERLKLADAALRSQDNAPLPLQFITNQHDPYISGIQLLVTVCSWAAAPPGPWETSLMAEFRELLEQQIPRLRRYAVALTRHPNDADDLVQDTLARALAKEHLWQPGTDLRAWLFTILHNQRVNAVRRGVREGTPVDLESVSSAVVAATDPSASRTLFELDRAMGQIAEEQRQVILLVGLEGMSYENAAAVVGVPIGTIRSRLSRGRDALRAAMGISDQRHLARAA
ncbi:MAG TPA: RNA polymerase sigma factor [Xanthobacteraceae bacterium]